MKPRLKLYRATLSLCACVTLGLCLLSPLLLLSLLRGASLSGMTNLLLFSAVGALAVALPTTLLALGFVLFTQDRLSVRLERLVYGAHFVTSQLCMPVYAAALLLVSPNGSHALALYACLCAIALTHAVYELLGDARRLSRPLQVAARALGANHWQMLRNVALPFMLPRALATLLTTCAHVLGAGSVYLLLSPLWGRFQLAYQVAEMPISPVAVPAALTLTALSVLCRVGAAALRRTHAG